MEKKNDGTFDLEDGHRHGSISKESEESQRMDDSCGDDDRDSSENSKEAPNEYKSEEESQESSTFNTSSDNSEPPPPTDESEISLRKNDEEDEEGIEDDMYLMILYKLVHKGDWRQVKHLLELHPDALSAKISSYGDTALHIAVVAGHIKIVEELVHMTSVKDLEIENNFGETALSLAASGGMTMVAKPLVRKNHDLLGIKNVCDVIPVVVAAQFGHTDMVHFLYHMTQEEDLDPEISNQGAKLLTICIVAQIYDIALDLVQQFPELATIRLKEPPGGTLNTLATRNLAFPSGTQFVFWQQWIYSCMPIHSSRVYDIRRDIEAYPGIPTYHQNIITKALSHFYGLVWDLLKLLVPCIRRLYDTKLKHTQVLELLDCISQDILALNHKQIKDTELFEAIFKAIKHGNVEFVEEILTAYPDIVWILDKDSRNIFLYAVLQRREKIFCLLHKMGPKKNLIATSLDKNGNSILHHAAMLSPSSHLDGISGAALQMQRELQWFEEVEKIVQPMYREMPNNRGKTARALFTLEHKKLREEGEKWMKDTATSCTVVAALIATVMFTAIFTVPGGYNAETGNPLYLYHDSFMVFILSDALSLFSSSSSVLMFLGILKSRYTEDEFLKSLPRKLIIGIATLFFSIATMMLTFGTTIFISLHNRLSWVSIPVILLSSVPVMAFVFPQIPLLYEICVSTYGPGIFERPKKNCFLYEFLIKH